MAITLQTSTAPTYTNTFRETRFIGSFADPEHGTVDVLFGRETGIIWDRDTIILVWGEGRAPAWDHGPNDTMRRTLEVAEAAKLDRRSGYMLRAAARHIREQGWATRPPRA